MTLNGELVTRQQIAALLGVTVFAVDQWRRRPTGFPESVGAFGNVPVWTKTDVVGWAERTGRLK